MSVSVCVCVNVLFNSWLSNLFAVDILHTHTTAHNVEHDEKPKDFFTAFNPFNDML